MAFGLKVWDADGNLTLDTTDNITRLVYTRYLNAKTTGSVEIPAVDGKSAVFIANCVNAPAFQATPLKVALSGTTLSWEPFVDYSGHAYGTDTLVFVFIYD